MGQKLMVTTSTLVAQHQQFSPLLRLRDTATLHVLCGSIRPHFEPSQRMSTTTRAADKAQPYHQALGIAY